MHKLAFLIAAPLVAQSGFTASYDASVKVRLDGVVTRVDWVNPHAYVFVSDAAQGNWAVEIGNALDLERDGWKRDLVKIGDRLMVDAIAARGNAKRAFATSVTLGRTNAKVFAALKRPLPKPPAEPTPRWPDGQPRLGAPDSKRGYWGAASANSLTERTSMPIAMSEEGILRNLSDARRVAPFQPWAKSVYEYRQRTLLKDDPFLRCLPPGGPRQFHTPHGFQFVDQRDLGRILILLGGGNRNWRVIFTDGRAQGTADEVVRSYYGNSVGKWEKDTLVVDSVGFNEKFWFSNGGLPHTEALHLIERFTRPNLGTLQYEVTVDDPRAYTRQWTGGWNVQWVANEEIQEYFCEENAETTFAR